MKVQPKLNRFRLIGQLSDKSGRRFRREMSIATSETFDQISDRADRLLTYGRDNVELDSFMLIPAPDNDKPDVSEPPSSRLSQAMSAAADVLGIPKPTTEVVQSTLSVIPPGPPPAGGWKPFVDPAQEDLKAENGINLVMNEISVVKLDATPEETEICFVSKK